jgi:hypothetical protein
MKKTVLISAAVSGLILGATSTTFAACTSEDKAPTGEQATEALELPKHACKTYNDCKNQGGCKTGDNGCKAKNSCKGKGGCATVAHHGCAKQNECAKQGGCGSGDNGCKAKNSCKGKGGCAVPIKH